MYLRKYPSMTRRGGSGFPSVFNGTFCFSVGPCPEAEEGVACITDKDKEVLPLIKPNYPGSDFNVALSAVVEEFREDKAAVLMAG
jgi:hypothetical protein